MIVRVYRSTAGALMVLTAMIASLPAGAAPQGRHASIIAYGDAIPSHLLSRARTVDLGKQPSAAAAIRAAKRARLGPHDYALARIPNHINNGRVAIDAKGVVHVVTQSMMSGPNQKPPVAPTVVQSPQP